MHSRRRFIRTLVVLGMVAFSGCYSSSIAAPEGLEDITSIVLRAWEDTRVGLPPLAVTRQDSVAIVMDFINTRRSGWENAPTNLPGNPLFAELRRGTVVASRFGFIELVHGGGGYFIADGTGKTQLRPASADEIAKFLAFFGISVRIVEP